MISCPAGSGKSTLVKSIVEELRKTKPIALLSKTHVAADNMSLPGLAGVTSDAWTRRHVLHGTYTGAVWLDECSVLDVQQYVLLNALSFGCCQFIINGDANLAQQVKQARRDFPKKGDARWHLVINHAK